MSNEPYVLITADTHAGGSHAHYREYLDAKYATRSTSGAAATTIPRSSTTAPRSCATGTWRSAPTTRTARAWSAR